MINTQLIGYLGQDCQVNNINGKTVINFSVAHSESWTDSTGVKKEKSIWVACSWWADNTKIAQYLKKSTQVYVEGLPEAKTYQNKAGETIPQLHLRVKMLQLLGSKKEEI